jgi:hypothetical protein
LSSQIIAKDIISQHLSDLGGEQNTSAAERSIIRRAAILTVELERLEAKFASAGEATATDFDPYQRGAGNLRRLLEAVGLQRRSRELNPPDPLTFARVTSMNIVDVIADHHVFGQHFRGQTWTAWQAFLRALFALPMSEEQLELYKQCTGRPGSSSADAAESHSFSRPSRSFSQCSKNWRPYLGPGEVGTVMIVARERRQARHHAVHPWFARNSADVETADRGCDARVQRPTVCRPSRPRLGMAAYSPRPPMTPCAKRRNAEGEISPRTNREALVNNVISREPAVVGAAGHNMHSQCGRLIDAKVHVNAADNFDGYAKPWSCRHDGFICRLPDRSGNGSCSQPLMANDLW